MKRFVVELLVENPEEFHTLLIARRIVADLKKTSDPLAFRIAGFAYRAERVDEGDEYETTN